MTTDLPPGLEPLVKQYEKREQRPVTYSPTSWAKDWSDGTNSYLSVLHGEHTEPTDRGRRTVDRHHLLLACEGMDLEDELSVLQTFVLVMAWGGGTGSRTIYNTRLALADPAKAHKMLSRTARALRDAADSTDLVEIYDAWRLHRVGRAFFTKWFTFAGYVEERDWQPLILDRRVFRTLNDTLDVSTETLAGVKSRAWRYRAYVEAMHAWSAEFDLTASELEWVLFRHNGDPLP
ncbi:8-oxoguanine DNA glycosylase OGG fold protein [Kribbella endophytica]